MLQTNAIGHVEHRAGDRMYVDFAGDRLEIVDETTAGSAEGRGVRRKYFRAAITHTARQCVVAEKEDLIKACENAIRFYGGAPRAPLCWTT